MFKEQGCKTLLFFCRQSININSEYFKLSRAVLLHTILKIYVKAFCNYVKQKTQVKTFCLNLRSYLVQVTGFEPTRISSLEPDGNDTAVETPVPVLSLFAYLL